MGLQGKYIMRWRKVREAVRWSSNWHYAVLHTSMHHRPVSVRNAAKMSTFFLCTTISIAIPPNHQKWPPIRKYISRWCNPPTPYHLIQFKCNFLQSNLKEVHIMQAKLYAFLLIYFWVKTLPHAKRHKPSILFSNHYHLLLSLDTFYHKITFITRQLLSQNNFYHHLHQYPYSPKSHESTWLKSANNDDSFQHGCCKMPNAQFLESRK